MFALPAVNQQRSLVAGFLGNVLVHEANEVDEYLRVLRYSFVRPLGVVKLLHCPALAALHTTTTTNYTAFAGGQINII